MSKTDSPGVQGGSTSDSSRTSAQQLALNAKRVEQLYKDKYAGTPIVIASELGRVNDIFHLVRGYNGDVPAMLAAFGINTRGERCNALMAAASTGRAVALRYLCGLRVDTTIKDTNNRNALHYLCMFRNIHTKDFAGHISYRFALDTLLRYMPLDAINQKNTDGQTPFDMVADLVEKRVEIAGLHHQHPTLKYYYGKLRSEGALRQGEYLQTECLICMEKFKAEESVTKLQPCGHIFHFEHIERWLLRSNKCPTCMTKVTSSAPATQRDEKVKVFKGYSLRALKF